MIIGIGSDLIDIRRVAQSLEKFGERSCFFFTVFDNLQ